MMSGILWRDMTRAELDKAYDNTNAVADSGQRRDGGGRAQGEALAAERCVAEDRAREGAEGGHVRARGRREGGDGTVGRDRCRRRGRGRRE